MKWWHWLILELLILFGITTWIYFFPDGAEVNLAKGAFGFALIYFIETLRNAANDKKEVPKKGTSEEKDKMFKTELDWVSAYKKLEEDNADLKQSLDWANELFKENATLKKEIEISQRCWQDQKNISLDTNCKLQKAKELLREIIDTPAFNQMGCDLYENEGYTELVEEAEQFLKQE